MSKLGRTGHHPVPQPTIWEKLGVILILGIFIASGYVSFLVLRWIWRLGWRIMGLIT